MTETKCNRCMCAVYELDCRKEGAMCFTLYDRESVRPQWWSLSITVANANTDHDQHLCKACIVKLLEGKP